MKKIYIVYNSGGMQMKAEDFIIPCADLSTAVVIAKQAYVKAGGTRDLSKLSDAEIFKDQLTWHEEEDIFYHIYELNVLDME